jgi:zinc transport system permease protein
MDEVVLRSSLAAVGVAVAAGPLGTVVLWRRMVYFGDTISHAALLGVAFALALNLPIFLGVLVCALGIAALVLTSSGRFHHTNTLLGVAAHSSLSLGLVAVALLGGSADIDLESYLIGDIEAVDWADVAIIWSGGAMALGLSTWRWTRLLIASLDREMALAQGRNPDREAIYFTVALALLVAVAIQVVGALLITALLIIPAVAARLGAQTPERMVFLAAGLGALSAVFGLVGATQFGTPVGPTIVVAALGFLVLGSIVHRLLRLRTDPIG